MMANPTGGVSGGAETIARLNDPNDQDPLTPGAATNRSQAGESRLMSFGPPLGVLAGVIGLWYAIAYGIMNPARRRVALPPPHEVLSKGFLTWQGKSGRQGLKPILLAMLTTGKVALIGLIISMVVGIGLAIVMNRAKWIERAIIPYAVLIQTLPILALVPILRIWLSAGINARVMTCVLIAIFPVIINTLFGLQSTDRSHHELFTLHQAKRWTRLVKLELPGAMPSIFTGMRIAAGGCVIGAVVGDFFFTQGAIGIGRLINNYQKDTRIPEMFAATLVSSLFGIIIFIGFGMLSKRVLRTWHETARTEF